MKVTNLRRKLAAALVAGGLLSPAAAIAANLNENLVQNPGFENVDINAVIGGYNAVTINTWLGGGAAYSHDGSMNGVPAVIPDYANGTEPPSSGSFYFGSNAGDNESLATAITQDIDVSQGASGTLIASGNAAFGLSAYFSGFGGGTDQAAVQVDLLNSGQTSLATFDLFDSDNQQWTRELTAGTIPVGTATVRISAYGLTGGGGFDGYVDNVDFQVTDELILPALDFRVDRNDGSLILSNQTGSPVNISGYQLTSAFGGLDPANWVSIADNYDQDTGMVIDSRNNWTELTQAGAHGDLSEADLESGDGGRLSHTETDILGNAGTWIRNPNEDLVFQYISNGSAVTGIVNFVGLAQFASGDVDTDGDIDAVDWSIVRSNQHTDLSGTSLAEAYRLGDLTGDGENNHADFAAFKDAFDGANGAGSFAVMAASVPEPSSLVLVLASGLLICGASRRNAHT